MNKTTLAVVIATVLLVSISAGAFLQTRPTGTVVSGATSAGVPAAVLVDSSGVVQTAPSGGSSAVTIANGADVAEGSTTVDRCTTTDTTACTAIGLMKQNNYLMGTATGPQTGANSNSVVIGYSTLVSGTIATAMSLATSTSLVSGTASNYLYITSCQTSNGSTTVSTDILLQDGDGGTTLAVLPDPAASAASTGGGGGSFPFPTPLKVPTSGNALYAQNVTTGSSTKINCQGFRSTVSY